MIVALIIVVNSNENYSMFYSDVVRIRRAPSKRRIQ
jgi:hypothetical protein